MKLPVAAALALPFLGALRRSRTRRAALAWGLALVPAVALGLCADPQALARLRVDAVLLGASCGP
ncbi:hypothetical protein [Azohydromonas lata]|uniref:Uncharacterized protein n=1 Tax=Azohydromonas lata TaxID=45677 RepID=A0ABU5IEW6_9BURK|nr:hypothetical protein [Azohydromonas lata]MDZ5457667.1 hypothetical protein [Azohydromonas lata]